MSKLQKKIMNNQGGLYLELTEKPKTGRLSTILIGTIIICLLTGGILGYAISSLTTSSQISDLQGRVSTLQKQVSDLQSAQGSSSQNTTYENNTYFLEENVSLPQLYEQVKSSVVVVQGITVQYDIWGQPYYSEVQGSGFVSNLTGQSVIITNYHVVKGAINITVTFINGNTYAANVTGSDAYADLAVLSADAPQDEYKPLTITSSLTLKVGDPVVAVGSPLGLTGSMTSGMVSALGRTVSVSWSSYGIADCIQTTTPINPGNSGGPLLNYQGEVVGITSYVAITSQGVAAQGLGLAIPSSTILRETESLITTGSYNHHPWLGISFSPYFGLGTAAIEGLPDLTYEIAQAMGTNFTYGVLIESMTPGGPAATAGLQSGAQQVQILGYRVTIGGDIIVAINGARITGMDDLSTYLEEHTTPNQTVNVTIVRGNQTLPVTLGTRPPPT
jgi:S1-C subfamily serine protease